MDKKKPESNSTIEVSLTKKQKEDILNQLFDNGFYKKKIEYIPGRAKVVLRNLSVKDQLWVENKISEEKGNASYILHRYSYMILSKTIIGKETESTGQSMNEVQAKDFLDELPSPVIDSLLKEQRIVEAELQASLGVDVISENFSQGVDQLLDSEESSEESTLENQEV